MSIDQQVSITETAIGAMLVAPASDQLNLRDRNLQVQHRIRVRREWERLYNSGVSDSRLEWMPQANALATLRAIESRAIQARDGLLSDTA